MTRCKECYNNFYDKHLIYPERGYPYCHICFDGRLSLVDKKRFKPKHKKDIPFIKRSINDSEKTTDMIMGALTKRSNNFFKTGKYE